MRKSREYLSLKSMMTSTPYGRRRPYYVSGLTEGSGHIFLTSLAADFASLRNQPVFVFPDEKKAASFASFLNSVDVAASFLPAREYCFTNVASSHDFECERLCVLSSLNGLLGHDAARAVCTTADALLQITMPPSLLADMTVTISRDDTVDTEKLAKRLTAAGYHRAELVEAPGQFAVRGGIVDVYPPSVNNENRFGVRIELFGDEIDRLGYFSTETQRFADDAPDTVVFPPVRELAADESVRDAVASLVRRQIKRLGRTDGADENHTRAAKNLEAELEVISNGLDIDFADKYLPTIYPDSTCVLDYVTGPVIISEPEECAERFGASLVLLEQSLEDMTSALELPPQGKGLYMREYSEIREWQKSSTVYIDSLSRSHEGVTPGGIFTFNTRHVPAYSGNLQLFKDDLERYSGDGYLCAVICGSENEMKPMGEALISDGYTAVSAESIPDSEAVLTSKGKKPVLLMYGDFAGYEVLVPKFILMNFSGSASRFSRGRYIPRAKKKKSASEAIMSYADLNVGDIVVHDAYGIGEYKGVQSLTIDGSTRDYITIQYAGTDKLFLPVDQLDHVGKYIGAGSVDGAVKLSKMGGTDWYKAKSRAKAATREMAKELIDLYARRKRTEGIAYPPDDEMSREFADSFEYEETEGQLQAISDIRSDMEKNYPMDRLLCGDVGYGKTEVALRAAFKAVMGGKQVAVLVPTTILAYQHYQTFLSRMRSFPVNVDMVSRFRKPKEQALSVRKVNRGETDIIIGTHRLISKDVQFADLGLVIIDEEQRFGVAQKEKLKKLAVNADVLTLTATPIPRTLNMAMGGIVDMSVLDEAPGMRSPVQTYVMEYDEAVINEAIRRELRRGGQVFYMYNNVEQIYHVSDRIAAAIPEARIAVAHGKMERDDIEDVWNALIRGEIDILVCTTIIETGVDIPNANTLIIENADRYGLSQLHQIRGRVGRSSTRAYAYFTYRKGKELTEIASRRLSAIREYAEFGAGFRIALRDLEIRGAGNLLGAEQHGHMEAVGYDLYMKLLEEAVIEEKGEKLKEELPECVVDIRCDAYLTKSYISSAPQRMDMYKRIARITTSEDYDDLIDELCDRYGEPDSSAVNLCRIARIRALGRKFGFSKIEEKDGIINLYTAAPDAGTIQKMTAVYPNAGVRVLLGQNPYITMKKKSTVRSTQFVLELMEKYESLAEG